MSEKTLNGQGTSGTDSDMTARTEPIRGKVAKVISTRVVALNIGTNSGVQEGMLFDIVVAGTLEITDPETGEVLGTVQPSAKARVKVYRVNKKISLASTYRTESIGGLRLRGDHAFGIRVETLHTRDTLHEAFSERTSYVIAGDAVVQVIESS